MGREVGQHDDGRGDAADGDPGKRPEATTVGDEHGTDEGCRRADEEHRLPGERGERDEDPGRRPATVPDGEDRDEEAEDHRRLLARAVGGQVEEALEAEEGDGRDHRGGAGAGQVAGDDVHQADAGDRQEHEEHARAVDVTEADQSAQPDPDPGEDVREGTGAVQDADVRRLAVQEALSAVGVDGEVAGEGLVEPVQQVDHEADHGDRRDHRVRHPDPESWGRRPRRGSRRTHLVGGRDASAHVDTPDTHPRSWVPCQVA